MAVRYGEPSADSLEKTLLKFCKLVLVKSPPLRIVLCRFRIRYHLLEIDRGRYQRPKPKPAHQHYMSELSTTG